VKSVHDGGEALAELRANDFEILILDVMLPSVGGFDVLRKLGASYQTPILMLTARGDDVDRIVGLELGADDYLSKPSTRASWWRACARFCAAPATAPAAATSRTSSSSARSRSTPEPICARGAKADSPDRRRVPGAGDPHALGGPGDFARGHDRTGARAQARRYDRSIDTHISNLRRKLDLEADKNPVIKNVRGSATR